MKQVLFFLAALFLLNIPVKAQKIVESVYLKNGSIIKGVILEQVPAEYLKLQTYDGSIYFYKMEDVINITKDASNNNYPFHRFDTRENGYRGFIDLGYSIGISDLSLNRFEVSTSHGLHLSPFFFIGIGTGIHYYYADQNFFVFPIFVDPRVYFIDGDFSPFFDLKIGQSFGDSHGLYLNASIGTSFKLPGNKSINSSLGYSLQRGRYEYSEIDRKDFNFWHAGAMTLKVGFEF